MNVAIRNSYGRVSCVKSPDWTVHNVYIKCPERIIIQRKISPIRRVMLGSHRLGHPYCACSRSAPPFHGTCRLSQLPGYAERLGAVVLHLKPLANANFLSDSPSAFSSIFFQSANIRPENLVHRVPELPVSIGLVVIKGPILAQLRSITNNVARKPAQNRDRTQHALGDGRLWREGFGQGTEFRAADGRNVRHEFRLRLGLGCEAALVQR